MVVHRQGQQGRDDLRQRGAFQEHAAKNHCSLEQIVPTARN